jgi:uncharacterized protein (DUF58 family)
MVGLTIRFRGVEAVFAGQRADFRFHLQGRGAVPRFQLQLYSDEHQDRPTASAHTDVPAGEGAEALLPVPTVRRGRMPLTRLGVATRHPFGLFRAWSWLHMDCSVLVYPAPAPDAPEMSSADGDAGGTWDERSGEEDFSGLRAFRDGDSPRHIAWKAYARDNEPRTKHYAGQTLSSRWLDFHALPDADPEVRLQKLARMILDAESQGIAYGLQLPGESLAPGLGTAHRSRCLQALALFDGGTGAAARAA